jgi:hypothetical protein
MESVDQIMGKTLLVLPIGGMGVQMEPMQTLSIMELVALIPGIVKDKVEDPIYRVVPIIPTKIEYVARHMELNNFSAPALISAASEMPLQLQMNDHEIITHGIVNE